MLSVLTTYSGFCTCSHRCAFTHTKITPKMLHAYLFCIHFPFPVCYPYCHKYFKTLSESWGAFTVYFLPKYNKCIWVMLSFIAGTKSLWMCTYINICVLLVFLCVCMCKATSIKKKKSGGGKQNRQDVCKGTVIWDNNTVPNMSA